MNFKRLTITLLPKEGEKNGKQKNFFGTPAAAPAFRAALFEGHFAFWGTCKNTAL
jgi:hypothetical protein